MHWCVVISHWNSPETLSVHPLFNSSTYLLPKALRKVSSSAPKVPLPHSARATKQGCWVLVSFWVATVHPPFPDIASHSFSLTGQFLDCIEAQYRLQILGGWVAKHVQQISWCLYMLQLMSCVVRLVLCHSLNHTDSYLLLVVSSGITTVSNGTIGL